MLLETVLNIKSVMLGIIANPIVLFFNYPRFYNVLYKFGVDTESNVNHDCSLKIMVIFQTLQYKVDNSSKISI